MFHAITLKHRVVGCLLAGALGDAWGGPSEGATGPVAFQIPARPVISDDTELTLATCESIVKTGRVDPADIASHLLAWFQAGRVHGIGSSTLKAMRDLAAGSHWALAGTRGEFAAGNGAAMRIAPLAFLLDPANQEHRTLIRDVCRITHHNDEAYAGALAVVLAIRAVITGVWSSDWNFLHAAAEGLPDSAVRDRVQQLQSMSPTTAGLFGASGYVVDSVPLALYFAQSIAWQSLDSVLVSAISVGGDADTIASIAGQVAGTVVGPTGVPRQLLAHIDGSEEMTRAAEAFASFVDQKNSEISQFPHI